MTASAYIIYSDEMTWLADLLKLVSAYLPDPFSITGMILYSFIVYLITFSLSYLRVKVVNSSLES